VKRLVDRFADEASACRTLPSLHALLADTSRELGFDHFALVHHASIETADAAYFKLHNYPEDWVEELLTSGLGGDDPVHLASRRVNTGFNWQDLGGIIHLTDRHKAILTRGRRFGLDGGFTVPANVPGEPSGSCSFAVRQVRDLPSHRLKCAELIGAHAFEAARRIRNLTKRPQRPHLSRREIQCLRLVGLGKTDWEIATILGIGVETVRQYVKRARAAYDVVSRTQLVVHGLRDNWLSFEELLPPRP
jgi:LuxR family quorum-sensing system transcriptional regulator CciR